MNLNRSIMNHEIKTVIKSLPTNRNPHPDGFIGEFYHAFKEYIAPYCIPKNTKGRNATKHILLRQCLH
jgi:hypothetical protein